MADDEHVRKLEHRLWHAERVCGLVGMTASDRQTERGKALTQAWMNWSHEYQGQAVRVSDMEVTELARQRDEIVEATLERLARDYPEIRAQRRADLP